MTIKKQAPQLIHADDLYSGDGWNVITIGSGGKFNNGKTEYTCTLIKAVERPSSKNGLFSRIKLAYGVFTGKYDALYWRSQ